MVKLPTWLKNAGETVGGWFNDLLTFLKNIRKENKEAPQGISSDALQGWTGDDKSAAEAANNTSDTTTDCTTGNCPCETPKWVTIVRNEEAKNIYEKNERGNERVKIYHDATDRPEADGRTAWCSSFLSWSLKKAGERNFKATANAVNFGESMEQLSGDDAFKLGAIWVADRGFFKGSTEWKKGHSSMLVGVSPNKKKVALLGGNQGNRIQVTVYYANDYRIRGWPKGAKTKVKNACFAPNNISNNTKAIKIKDAQTR